MSNAVLGSPFPAVILAGGQGRRMGRIKAQVKLGSKELVLHAVDLVRETCAPIIVSVRHHDDLVFKLVHNIPDVTAVCDRYPVPTPMTGIVSSMEYLRSSGSGGWILLTSCDVLFHPWRIINMLAQKAELIPGASAAVYRMNDRFMPYPGLFHMDTLGAWKDALQNNRFRVQEFLSSLPGLQSVDAHLLDASIPDWYLANINTVKDLEEAHALKYKDYKGIHI